jgi:Glycosyl Hydrolase Family 88/Alpha-L-fucosidase
LGWFTMGVVDVLDFLPEDHPQRPAIIEIFRDMMAAIARVQDAESGTWYQVLDRGGQPGNYLEASGSCMFVYSAAKGVRKGYLDPQHMDVARKGYAGIIQKFITVDDRGLVDLNQICRVAAFDNGSDGSCGYYINQPIVANDFKGVGPFVLASVEMETVMLKPTARTLGLATRTFPQFKADQFNPDQWAELFKRAGARYVVPVAEHHNGFAMYDTVRSQWCAVKMGPKRDTLGELAKAVRKQGLVFGVSSHRAEHWWFFDGGMHFDSDVQDPRYYCFFASLQKATRSTPSSWLGLVKDSSNPRDRFAALGSPSRQYQFARTQWATRVVT